MLVVVGTSLLDSVISSMSRSIIGSVSGHIQVYSSRSKDPLEVVGSFNFEGGDLDEIDDFAKMRETLQQVPNVKAVVPMGISGAIVSSGNTIDVALGQLRDLYRRRDGRATARRRAARTSRRASRTRRPTSGRSSPCWRPTSPT